MHRSNRLALAPSHILFKSISLTVWMTHIISIWHPIDSPIDHIVTLPDFLIETLIESVPPQRIEL